MTAFYILGLHRRNADWNYMNSLRYHIQVLRLTKVWLHLRLLWVNIKTSPTMYQLKLKVYFKCRKIKKLQDELDMLET